MEQKPKYIEICDWIKQQIDRRELSPGEKIYSENELMQIFSVSRQTVRHAISCLEFDHLVIRKRGSGTYISGPRSYGDRSVHSRQIAIVTTYIDEYIFPKIIKSIEKAVFEEDYSMQVASTHNSVEMERRILSKLVGENMVSGLIIEPTRSALPNPNIHLYRDLINQDIPIVLLNSYYPDLKVPHVSMNDKQAGRQATKFLIEKGHRRIGAIFKADDGQGHRRYLGYIEALMEAGIEIEEENVLWITTGDVEQMKDERNRYLRRMREVTACLCYNDTVAGELMSICLESGIRVPEELSIMGIDDADMSKDLPVPLTTVHNPLQRLGKLSAEVVMKMIAQGDVEEAYELKASVVERSSVRAYME